MEITLYKNCKLTKNYKDVYYRVEKLENYLQTLDNFTTTTNDIFTQYQGIIKLNTTDINYDLYKYNYMKLVDNPKGIIRYCFIDDTIITSINLTEIYYTEDYWSNYSLYMKMKKALLTRCSNSIPNNGRIKLPFCKLPIDYMTNSEPLIKSLTNNVNDEVYILCQFQAYDTKTSGDFNNRIAKFGIVRTDMLGQGIEHRKNTYTLLEAQELISKLIMLQSYVRGTRYTAFKTPTFIADYDYTSSAYLLNDQNYVAFSGYNDIKYYCYCNFGSFYLLPKQLGNSLGLLNYQYTTIMSTSYNIMDANDDIYKKLKFSTNPNTVGSVCAFCSFIDNSIINKLTTITSGILGYDFTRTTIGTIGHQIPVNNYFSSDEKSTIHYSLKMFLTTYDFKILLFIENDQYDVTKDFEITIPIDAINGETNSQRKMSRSISNLADFTNIAMSLGTIIAGGVGANKVIGSYKVGKDIEMSNRQLEYLPLYNKSGKLRGNATIGTSESMKDRNIEYKELHKGIDTGSIISSSGSIIDSALSLVKNNAPLYTSNSISNGDILGIINAYFGGLVEMRMQNIINYDIITRIIEDEGYDTCYYQSENAEEILNSNAVPSTAFKFDNVIVYGPFPSSVAEVLKTILLNGVKIHY